jgi:hypothetical protein
MSRRRRVRDIYGNWVYEDPDEKEIELSKSSNNEEVHLDWRDYIALTIASLETFLLPIVVFIIVIIVLAIGLAHI